MEVRIDDEGSVRLVRMVPRAQLIRRGGRLVARPQVSVKKRPDVDVAAPSSRGNDARCGMVTSDVSGPGGYADGDHTESFSGTSAAAPVVAGIAGLMLSANPALTAAQLRLLLASSAEPGPTPLIVWWSQPVRTLIRPPEPSPPRI